MMDQIDNTGRVWLSGVIFLLLAMMVSIASSFARENPTEKIEERIHQEIGQFTIEIFPHSNACRRVYQVIEKQNYLVCLVRNDLEVYLMKELSHMGTQPVAPRIQPSTHRIEK